MLYKWNDTACSHLCFLHSACSSGDLSRLLLESTVVLSNIPQDECARVGFTFHCLRKLQTPCSNSGHPMFLVSKEIYFCWTSETSSEQNIAVTTTTADFLGLREPLPDLEKICISSSVGLKREDHLEDENKNVEVSLVTEIVFPCGCYLLPSMKKKKN